MAEAYCSISENFRVAYTNETGESSIETTPASGEIVILRVLHNLEG